MAKLSKLKIWSLLLSAAFLLKCANQLPPTGGEEDKIPPEVLEVYPPNGTTNFEEDYFEIEFSEYVDTRSVQDAIFISPQISEVLEYDWSGRTVEITFEDSLKPNTTYTVTIGTDVVDLNNKNKMARSFVFAFSTGSEIDNGLVEGRVHDDKAEGVLITAYKLGDAEVDPTVKKPDYRSQAGKNGDYTLLGLAPGKYRVFALKDDYRDFLYNIGDDEYGVPYKEIELTRSDSVSDDLNFMLTIEDTIKPDLFNVTMTDRNHLLVEFGEYIDSTRISSKNFFIVDSSSDNKFPVRYFFKGKAKAKSYFLAISDSLTEGNDLYLASFDYRDNFGNTADTQYTSIIVNSSPDTAKNNFHTITTPLGGKIIDFEDPVFVVRFEDGFDTTAAGKGVQFLNKKEESLPFKIKFIDDASFEVAISKTLESRSDFTLKIDQRYFTDIAGNVSDSVHTEKISTNNELNFSGAFGRVLNISEDLDVVVVLSSVENKSRNYTANLKKTRDFEFSRVLPGQYLLRCFVDDDGNGQFNYGAIYPFQPSERFHFYPDTLLLRARWPVTDVFLKFPD